MSEHEDPAAVPFGRDLSPARATEHRNTRALRVGIAVVSGFVAFWAYAGAVGLAGGGADPRGELTPHLPFQSPVLAAIALAVVIGVPMTYATVGAIADRGDAALATIGSGLLLIAWVAVQPFVIDQVYWLQPVCGVLGLIVVWLGIALRRGRAA